MPSDLDVAMNPGADRLIGFVPAISQKVVLADTQRLERIDLLRLLRCYVREEVFMDQCTGSAFQPTSRSLDQQVLLDLARLGAEEPWLGRLIALRPQLRARFGKFVVEALAAPAVERRAPR